MKQRTVLILHRGGDQLRGSEDALLSLLRGMDRDALRPVVLSTNQVMHEAAQELGVESHLREYPEIMMGGGERRFPLRGYVNALRDLRAFARARKVDLFLCNGGGPCQLGIPAAASLGKPLVCLLHHPAPRIYHLNWLTPLAPTFIFVSHFTAGHTRGRIGRTGQVVHVGLDERFAPAPVRDPALRRSLGFADDDVVFAQVGALVPHKGHRALIDAFERASRDLPAARLLIVGDGPEREPLRSLVRERGLDGRVVLTGRVDDVLPYFRHVMDVHVLASREEGLGLVNLQASACGIPVLASGTTGIRETVMDGETGLFFPVGDAPALAAAMHRLARDPGLRAALGRRGRQMVTERFSSELYCRRIQEILSTMGSHRDTEAQR